MIIRGVTSESGKCDSVTENSGNISETKATPQKCFLTVNV